MVKYMQGNSIFISLSQQSSSRLLHKIIKKLYFLVCCKLTKIYIRMRFIFQILSQRRQLVIVEKSFIILNNVENILEIPYFATLELKALVFTSFIRYKETKLNKRGNARIT